MIISAPFRDHNPRLAILAGGVGLGLLVLLAALFRVQVIQAERYANREEAQSFRRIRIPSARGEIVDRTGVVLADNRPSYDIAIYLNQFGRIKKSQNVADIATPRIQEVSQVLGLPVTVTSNDICRHYAMRRPLPLPLWRGVTKEQIAIFEEQASHLPGANLIVNPVRFYPQGQFAAHLLGFCGRAEATDEDDTENFYYYQADSAGKQGVERAFNDDLRGAPGGHTIQVNPSGVKVRDVSDEEAERGNRVVLTIDARIQRLVENALEHTPLPAGRELRGCAVVIDPRNGEILALASVPTFNPNIFTPGTPADLINGVLANPGKPMLNRVTGARYAPGSTFKPITLLAGLESGAINAEDRVTCAGSLKIGDHTFGCWLRSGHGTLDAYMAMLESCDVWFYQEGMRTGVDAISRMAMEFGLGRPTGIDFGHELSGLVPTPSWKLREYNEKWWEGDTAQLAIGQSFLLVTPLQMANVAATLANGGTRWQPFVVQRIEAPDGQVLQQTQPTVASRLSAKPQHIAMVRHAMLGAVEDLHGSGHPAAVRDLEIAGKTGTAEFDLFENGTKRRINRAWFTGFAPYQNPSVAVAVLIEDGVSGGHTAGPVAAQIFAGIFNRSAEPGNAGGGYAD